MTTRDTTSLAKCPTCGAPITLTQPIPHVFRAAVEHEPDCAFQRIKRSMETER